MRRKPENMLLRLSLLSLPVVSLLGELGLAEYRTWTYKSPETGEVSRFDAEFQRVEENRAIVKTRDGKTYAPPLADLSPEDVQYLSGTGSDLPTVGQRAVLPGLDGSLEASTHSERSLRELRVWTYRQPSGGRVVKFEAEFVGVKGLAVMLKATDGKNYELPLANLSPDDARYVEQASKSAPAPLRSRGADRAVPIVPTELFLVNNSGFAACQGRVVFTAHDRDRGYEPWVTDGTAAGTKRLKDIYPGPKDSKPFGFVTLGDKVLFWARDGLHGGGLWATDGTEAGTTFLKDFRDYSSHTCRWALFKENVYFLLGSSRLTLYKSDGTADGTVELRSGIPHYRGNRELIAHQDGVYIFTYDGLWKTDGTCSGTELVSQVRGIDNTRQDTEFSSPDMQASWRPVCVGRTVFFGAYTPDAGVELWKSDGTEVGTTMIRDIRKGFGPGYDERDRSSDPQWLTVFNNEVYFVARDDVDQDRGRELWKTDGTEVGTVMVKDIHPGSASSKPASLIAWNNAVYFTANTNPNAINERGLWKSDGTAAGTVQVQGLPYLSGQSPYKQLSTWTLSWPVTCGGCLYMWGEYGLSYGVAKFQPGSPTVTLAFEARAPWTPNDFQYNQPQWVVRNGTIVFLAGKRLWSYGPSPAGSR